MAQLLIPFHQFEIRFTPMLDFSQIGKSLYSAFVRIPKSIGIDNEGSSQEVIKLISEEDLYLILISWDRIVLRFEGDLHSLLEKNSIVETILFGMLTKAKTHPSFGVVKNCLSYSIFLKEIPKERGASTDYFKAKYLSTQSLEILKDANDYSITLEKKNQKLENNITIGPYKGLSDFTTRNINLFATNPLLSRLNTDLIDHTLMISSKYVRKQPDVGFSLYKEIVEQQIKLANSEI